VPAEARKIPFLAEITKVAAQGSGAPTPTGEQQ